MRDFIIFVVLLFQSVICDGDSNCAEQQFRCNDGKCIPQQWLCDGARDCADSSDEAHEACDKHSNRNSPCFGNQPECQKSGSMRCIPHEWLCDGHPDCDKGEDEANCSSVQWFRHPESLLENYYRKLSTQTTMSPDDYCKYGEFRCTSGECIKRDKVCDKKKDCKDESDESLCDKNLTTSNVRGSSTTSSTVTTSTTTSPTTIPSTTPIAAPSTLSTISASLLKVPPTSSSLLSTTTTLPITKSTESTTTKGVSTSNVLSSTTTTTATSTLKTTEKPSTTTSTPKIVPSSTSTLAAPIKPTELLKSTHEPVVHTTQAPLKHLHLSQPVTTTTLPPPVSLVKSPYLIKAIQPPLPLQKATSPLPFTPIMALLFVTASPNNKSASPNSFFKYSDTPQQISPEVVENLVRGSRSSENGTSLKPVKFYKGIPIEPIHLNSTEYDSY